MEPFDTIGRIRAKEDHTIVDVEELRSLAKLYPTEPELWDVLGDVMQVCDADIPIEESIHCYRKAVECDSTFASAYASLGWAFDSYLDEFEAARRYFEMSIKYGGGDTARIGLARVLAQIGDSAEAIRQLAECDDKTRADWIEMSQEIREGIWCSLDDCRGSNSTD